jgi:hypothetical protein
VTRAKLAAANEHTEVSTDSANTGLLNSPTPSIGYGSNICRNTNNPPMMTPLGSSATTRPENALRSSIPVTTRLKKNAVSAALNQSNR